MWLCAQALFRRGKLHSLAGRFSEAVSDLSASLAACVSTSQARQVRSTLSHTKFLQSQLADHDAGSPATATTRGVQPLATPSRPSFVVVVETSALGGIAGEAAAGSTTLPGRTWAESHGVCFVQHRAATAGDLPSLATVLTGGSLAVPFVAYIPPQH